ncbi:MAG: uracil phosphoribosyltransferase [Thermincola sp.]|nr:uracil phosphoribosyltransferase [Thermincola sp.]MDT3702334.1 uracil phosphoribosyltransferase [Thermincola sp.]
MDNTNVHIMQHPLIKHKISYLRDKNTGTKIFNELVSEISMLICFEATRNLPLEIVEIETPLAVAKAEVIRGKKMAIIPILRAGLGMVDGVKSLVPNARVGHIGLYRDETTLQPVEYYCKMPPDIDRRDVFVLDPMLATGGSAAAAIQLIKEYGAKSIKLLCIIAAPEGIKKITATHPDVEIFCGTVDSCLNEHGYIVPGLGDAGDRIFGTK